MINKTYCMSHFLAFRFIKDKNMNFFEGLKHNVFEPKNKSKLQKVSNIKEIEAIIIKQINDYYIKDKTAILLSGGIDSAILSSYLPEGTIAYTLKCNAKDAIDETQRAKQYANLYNLNHQIIEINWSDFLELTPEILKKNKVPFHSIEVQLLKAAKIAKQNGIERLIIGDSADYIFGGMDKLLSKDWDFYSFIKRYNYIEPEDVLKEFVDVRWFYEKYRLPNNNIDFIRIIQEEMLLESLNSYNSAFSIANISYLDPYSYMQMANPLDLSRIRNGEPKYLIRELFSNRFPNIPIPDKIPLPRATEQWLKNYHHHRDEFKPNCTLGLSGDQKWLIWCLEQFLDMNDRGEL